LTCPSSTLQKEGLSGTRCDGSQLAIVKALEFIGRQQVNLNEHRTAVIYTDNKITLYSIKKEKTSQLPRRRS